MIELLKQLLDITDTSKDAVLDHHLSKAKKSIQSYLNYIDDEFLLLENKFQTQIVDLAMYYFKNRNNAGISQISQGSRSRSFEKGIPLEILQLLPLPKARIVGERNVL